MEPLLLTKQKKNCWIWGAFILAAYLVSFNMFFSSLCVVQKPDEVEHGQAGNTSNVLARLPDPDPFVKELLEGICLDNHQHQVKPRRRQEHCVLQVTTVDAEQDIRNCSPFQGGSNALFGLKWCAWASNQDGHISADILKSRVPVMEVKPMEAFRAALQNKARGIVIDAGAQVGLYSAAALRAGHYTISIDILQEHIQMNLVSRALNNMSHETNGLVVHGALSNHCGQWATVPRQLQVKGNPGGTHISEGGVTIGWPLMKTQNEFHQLDKVPVVTLDAIMDYALHNLPAGVHRKVHALKIDIEGYEPFALMGASRLLSLSNLKPDIIIMEFFVRHIPNCNATRFLQSLAQLGYLIDVSPRLNVKCARDACKGMGFESAKFNSFLHHLGPNAEMDLVLRKI